MEKTNNILYVLANQNFQDEEYFETKKIFTNAGYKTTVSSTSIGTAYGKLGGSTDMEILFSEVDALDYVLVCGEIGVLRGLLNFFLIMVRLLLELEVVLLLWLILEY